MPTRKADPGEHGTYYRGLALDARTLDKEARTVRATLSTDTKIARFFGFEQLDHSAKAVDLNRASRGLPLLFSHDQTQPIGRAQNLELNGSDITADLRFGNSMRAEEVWQDVVEGVLADVSIGYRVNTWEEMPEGRIARKWELLEASVVAVPADAGAAIHREVEIMPEHETVDHRAGIIDAFRAWPMHAELMFRCIDEGKTVEQSRAALLAHLGTLAEPVQGSSEPVSAGEDKADKFSRAMDEALAVKFDARPRPELERMNQENTELAQGLISEHDAARKARGTNPLMGMSLIEMAREYAVTVHGMTEARGWRPSKVADMLLSTRASGGLIGHGPSDFTSLLANNQGKMLQVGYTEAPETWQQWCKTGTLNDFKTANRPVMSTFGDLDAITGDREYKYGTFSDRQETIALGTYGKLFSISRTAIINDDQNAFSEVPRAMGRAAARMVGDEVYDLILNNAALADGTALFHADHGNLTASGAAPSVAQLNTEYSNIALQTDPASNVLNLQARYILVPPQLWGTTRTLLSSALTPGGSNNDNNIWQAQLEQVTEPRIGDTGASPAGSAAIWYLMCSSTSVGTVEVGFLDGNQSPYLEQQDGFTRDGVIFKVRLDVGTAVLDHRGLYRNAGA